MPSAERISSEEDHMYSAELIEMLKTRLLIEPFLQRTKRGDALTDDEVQVYRKLLEERLRLKINQYRE